MVVVVVVVNPSVTRRTTHTALQSASEAKDLRFGSGFRPAIAVQLLAGTTRALTVLWLSPLLGLTRLTRSHRYSPVPTGMYPQTGANRVPLFAFLGDGTQHKLEFQ